MHAPDTIVAISSAVGAAARVIVRLSGPDAVRLLSHLCDDVPSNAGACKLPIRSPSSLAPSRPTIASWVYVFRAPKSYTGEDLIELHLPGNPLLVRLIVEDLIAQGARQATAGEFTSRAYLNGRLDLTAAEGVALTISAANESELRAARQLMSGELARRLVSPMESLAQALALLEAGIDFVEEDITFISSDDLRARIDQIGADLRNLLSETTRIDRITHEPRFALVGKPNAGKSTLLNALARADRAVISPVAGTTRDALSVQIALDRGVVTVIDVAGLERIGDDPHGIHHQMQDRARRTVEEADFVIHVIDATEPAAPRAFSRTPDLVVLNKCDALAPSPGTPGEGWGEGSALSIAQTLTPTLSHEYMGEGAIHLNAGLPHAARSTQHAADEHAALPISALTGHNLPALERAMSNLAFGQSDTTATLALGTRHVTALNECLASLEHARTALDTSAAELIAHDLREALDALGRILGHVSPDDVLGRIFGSFCIGK